MPLNKFVYINSIGTDAFYEPDEQAVHKRLLRLYAAKSKNKDRLAGKSKPWDGSWRVSALNRIINVEKGKLTELLDKRAADGCVRHLRHDALSDRNVINLFESSLTRALDVKPLTLTYDIMVINVFFFQVFENIVKQGFMFNGEKYVFLTASAGQIRTKRSLFIREAAFKRIEPRLMGGLTVNDINEQGGMNENKFLAYLALTNSATDVWEDFDIDKAIVVDDWETAVPGLVDHIDGETYEIKREQTDTVIPHMDGCGIMLDGPTRMVRLPFVKGLLVQFPFDKFLREKCTQDQWWVTDIYGVKHNVILEDIRYIFTKSQFKLYKYYPNWECYKARFKAYGCEAAYCNIEEPYIPKSRINYQMLQTLSDMTDAEIERISATTVDEIQSIGQDYQTTMRLLGATEYNKNRSPMQEALLLYPELFRDVYNKEILKQTKKSLVKQAMGGRLRVNGKYLFLSPDLYAFCEWLFQGKQNPQGLLEDGEVYCTEYKDGDELACLRSPHLYREWAIRNNRRTEELDRWFGQTKCIYTSCHDLISRYLMFDNDGDKALVVKDRVLTNCAKRNMHNIVPLAYDLKKAKGGMITPESLYEGMIKAYTGGRIGPVSNNITKIWNSDEITQEELDVVKWLCFENNAVIDFAKTRWSPTRPKNVDNIIRKYTKHNVPHFFIYAKDKEPWQVEPPNDSTMNRISKAIPPSRVKYSKSISKFDWRVLTDGGEYTVCENAPVIKAYNYCLRHQYQFNDENDNVKGADTYAAKMMREKILTESGAELAYVVNSLVAYLYTVKQSSNKRLLWDCFGWDIVGNIHSNVTEIGRICPICGKRFKPTRGRQDVYCSDECYINGNRQKTRERKESLAVKVVETIDNPQYFVVDNKN